MNIIFRFMNSVWHRGFAGRQLSFEGLIASVVIATAVIWMLYFLSLAFDLPVGHWWRYAALPGKWETFVRQPWSLVTYPWVHIGLVDFIVNLLLLYYIGTLFLVFEDERRLGVVFGVGAGAGALAFLLSYKYLPYFYGDEPAPYLTGISAGYIAWLAYLAAKYGKHRTYVRLLGHIRIRDIFFFFLFLDLVLLFTSNSGGHIAHLGAALAGWLYAVAGRLKTVRRNRHAETYPNIYDNFKTAREKEIDRILDKINRSGFDSLTEREKEILHRESKRRS